MNYDLDTRVGRAQQIAGTGSPGAHRVLLGTTAWLRPEILAAGSDKIRTLTEADPRLATYKQPLARRS